MFGEMFDSIDRMNRDTIRACEERWLDPDNRDEFDDDFYDEDEEENEEEKDEDEEED